MINHSGKTQLGMTTLNLKTLCQDLKKAVRRDASDFYCENISRIFNKCAMKSTINFKFSVVQ